jgi:hypothetical protein
MAATLGALALIYGAAKVACVPVALEPPCVEAKAPPLVRDLQIVLLTLKLLCQAGTTASGTMQAVYLSMLSQLYA